MRFYIKVICPRCRKHIYNINSTSFDEEWFKSEYLIIANKKIKNPEVSDLVDCPLCHKGISSTIIDLRGLYHEYRKYKNTDIFSSKELEVMNECFVFVNEHKINEEIC